MDKYQWIDDQTRIRSLQRQVVDLTAALQNIASDVLCGDGLSKAQLLNQLQYAIGVAKEALRN